MDNPVTRISVRNLVEFILQGGDLDNRRGTIDKDAMLKGSRLHRKIQKQMGGDYRAEVALRMNCSYEDLDIRLEGRADGIFTEDEVVWIDEIKGIYGNVEQMEEPVKVHKAQAMCYGYIYGVSGRLVEDWNPDDICQSGDRSGEKVPGGDLHRGTERMVPETSG